ncbi:uncharacterized protein Z520_05227 [Fonsecaea multimorphosa CBS 102226]|uniref:Uncharacterized protein n=1 Tax=Fonsecaea multimorphosa CBS 102226 TaxID=1442371 RepID=A0A0D2IP40_9EURO|nr:uncharacterized protein Z520_05227 [Fonsecaea multimorphosa CBS 102226]KIX98766.1 hypothetical protein Z520_05227 [Fonsecaea multimorphosa CBS 102226]OAL25048.1 hypothetical protein AYO22_04925 [Fonsecaea multimorphosa]
MATKKTVILRSLYDFSELASTELIQNDKYAFLAPKTDHNSSRKQTECLNSDAHDGPEAPAFFYFDAANQVFCADVDQGDQHTMPQFLTRMGGYIEYHELNPPGFDDEPRIRPVEGTVMADIIPEEYDEESAEKNVLLQYQSDEDSDDQDAPDGLLHLTTYWQPANGNIGILPPMYAKDITRLTGSSLFAEEAEKRYRIFQGNFNLAREKLLKLEPLLEIFEKQSGNKSFPATGNLLIWPPNQKDSRMQFVKMNDDHPGFQRVIVNSMEQTLCRKVIAELRPWDSKTREFFIPRNLQKVGNQPTVTLQASKIWDTELYESFGDPRNMDPIITSNSTSANNGGSVPTQERPDARIAAWTNNVVHSANPEIAPETPREPVAPTRRRVAIESDSEDEEPSTPVPKPVPSTTEDSTETRLVLLPEDEDLMEAEGPATQNSESPVSPLLAGNESALIDLSEEVSLDQAEGGLQAQSASHSALLHEGHEVDIITASYQEATSGHQEDHDNGGRSNETANKSPSQSDACPSSGATSYSQAEKSAEVHELSSSATDIASITPEAASVPPFERPSFHQREYGIVSNTRPFRGQRGQRGYRGRTNARYRGDGRLGTGQSYDHSESPRPTQPDGFRPRGPAGEFHQRGNGRLRPGYSGERATRARGFRGQRPGSTHHTLVDLGTPANSAHPSTVPPGLECNVPLLAAKPSRGNLNQSSDLGEPLPRSAAPSELETRSSIASGSSASGLTRLRFSEEGSDYVTTFVPRVDQSAIREKAIQQVQEAIAAMNKKAEDPSPKLHSTMRQQGKNPGKTSGKQETEAAKKARRAAALAEAYPTPTNTPPRSRAASPKPEEMSKWKRQQIKKKSALAEAHPDLVASDYRAMQTKKLISLLEPVFENGRAFSGKLTFELRFGQVLITPGQQLRDRTYHSVDDWKSYFDCRPASTDTLSNFTRILTSNGADIDRILEMKGDTGKGAGKLWNPTPGPQSVSYEFHCQSRFNEDFQIVVDQHGRYELRKGLVTVGDINIHVPAQVWDLSATLTGPLKWRDPPETVAQSVSAFVGSLYVLPGRNKLLLVFRQPNDLEIEVRNLVVKRDSYHSSNRPDGQEILLKMTEAKNLQFRVHPEDKRLWQGYEAPEKAYKDFADGGHIHYEMSLVHNGINDVLAKNEALEIGELTDTETTGKSLLDPTIIRSMLDIAVQIVSKMDFVGMRNYGTQQRLADQKQKKVEQLQAMLGGKAQTILQLPSVARGPSQAASRSPVAKNNSTAAGGASVVQQYVPGVRMNTEAQVVIDESGHRYRLGLGGARIPLVEDDETQRSGSGESVIPDDSASQAGGARAHLRSAPIGYKQTDRQAGFW